MSTLKGKQESGRSEKSQCSVDRSAAGIKGMFSAIAGEYDFFSHALSLNIDRLWRRRAGKLLARHVPPGLPVLDLCTGTGDLALELQKSWPVTACDFCRPMLEIAGRKISGRNLSRAVSLVEGDGMKLPFAPCCFRAVTLAFGFRNMEDYDGALHEIHRVIEPSGILMILDFSLPENRLFRKVYLCYLARVLPLAGKLLSGIVGPYRYLPASVRAFPERAEAEKKLEKAGFHTLSCRRLTLGVASIFLARKV